MTKNLIFAALFSCFLCSVGGYFYGYSTANEAHEAQQSKAIAAVEQTLRKHYQQQLTTANESVAQLRQQKATLAKTANELEKRIAHVSRPDCSITRGFVGLYNRAIGADLPTDDLPTGADREASSTDAADPSIAASAELNATVSDVNQQDILRHVIDYGGRCQQIETQLIQLIEYEEKVNESRRATGTD
ncbi:demethoxyubiquinone hydroxylase family protein [Neptunomonas sp.]|uniref:demethoxyubiquinone hydroxylase family protein n=1 Tax=Neptunomonas sp. TaxID=1971898 RepID=UPI0025F6F797|nr:demethoxyubiquinone hydroxylase family protein [Neptunomonas sp.]